MPKKQEKDKNTPLKLDEQQPIGLLKGSFNQQPREDSRAKKLIAIINFAAGKTTY